jgi:hypothetical protein
MRGLPGAASRCRRKARRRPLFAGGRRRTDCRDGPSEVRAVHAAPEHPAHIACPSSQAARISHARCGTYYVIAFNTLNRPFDNMQLRQALNYSIDRRRFADLALYGVTSAQDLPWLRRSPAFEASKQNLYPFDLEKAASLLSEAGVSGLEMDILLTPSAEGKRTYADVLVGPGKARHHREYQGSGYCRLAGSGQQSKVTKAPTGGRVVWSIAPGTTFSGSEAQRAAARRVIRGGRGDITVDCDDAQRGPRVDAELSRQFFRTRRRGCRVTSDERLVLGSDPFTYRIEYVFGLAGPPLRGHILDHV